MLAPAAIRLDRLSSLVWQASRVGFVALLASVWGCAGSERASVDAGDDTTAVADAAVDARGDGDVEFQCPASGSDLDRDGLDDGQERCLHGTDPASADSDHDGVRDGDEVADGTDPLEISSASHWHADTFDSRPRLNFGEDDLGALRARWASPGPVHQRLAARIRAQLEPPAHPLLVSPRRMGDPRRSVSIARPAPGVVVASVGDDTLVFNRGQEALEVSGVQAPPGLSHFASDLEAITWPPAAAP